MSNEEHMSIWDIIVPHVKNALLELGYNEEDIDRVLEEKTVNWEDGIQELINKLEGF